MDDDGKEANKINKQRRKMTKILAKAWNFDNADAFREDKLSSSSSQPIDLQIIGQKLDNGGYEHGRSGWESFSRDLGGVYQRHILGDAKAVSNNAKKHLQGVIGLLSDLDETFGEIACKAPPPVMSQPMSKKSPISKPVTSRNTSKVVATATSVDGKDSSRALSVTSGGGAAAAKRAPAGNRPKPGNQRTSEAEKKRLKKELDKLMKAHRKASKVLDDFRNEKSESRYPIEDELLEHLQLEENMKILQIPPDVCGFPGFPNRCIPDILTTWDFLCTFSRSLSLDHIDLDDYVSALIYRPPVVNTQQLNNIDGGEAGDRPCETPLYLAEAHIALLRLLLQDNSSNLWWWCTLFTEDDGDEIVRNANGNTSESKSSSKKRKKEKDDINYNEENLAPVVKINITALLNVKEDPEITALWMQALDSSRSVRANQGAPLKNAVKNALAITTNDYVKTYLKKSMKMFRKNSAGFTKRAIIWLVDKVREARPDLWGRNISQELIASQISKVAADATRAIEQMGEEVCVTTVNDDTDIEPGSDPDEALSDDDEDSEDEDILSQEDNEINMDGPEHLAKKNKSEEHINEDMLPVTSSVPTALAPTLVDILLPPSKPALGSSVLSPFAWPCLAGATCRRILHHYKRKRNEVDDDIRLSKQLPALTRGERKKREGLLSQRLFPACAKDDSEKNDDILELAVEHLCVGSSYSLLTPIQKLCILRVLIEAAYDSHHISQCVENNLKDRANAIKAVETEERRAKKEAREESAAADRGARERLSDEARALLIAKKHREIKKQNKRTSEYTNEFIDEMIEEDIVNIDEDAKADFEALPLPESFSKAEVAAMVAKMQEESAFDTNSLIVLTMEEILTREQESIEELKEEVASYGSSIQDVYGYRVDREISAKVDKLKKEITNLECDMLTLPQVRARACDELLDAIEDGTVKALRTAIKNAKLAVLMGQDNKTGGIWTLDVLRDAYLELKAAEKRRKVTDAKKELVERRNRCIVRTEPIGRDRFGNRYWHFSYDYTGRTWAEQLQNTFKDPLLRPTAEEDDILPLSLKDQENDAATFLDFCRMDHQGSIASSSTSYLRWGGHCTDKSLRLLIKCLDERGIREGALKANLKEAMESRVAATDKMGEGQAEQVDEFSSSDVTNKNLKVGGAQQAGDGEAFRSAKILFMQDVFSDVLGHELLEDIASAIGRRVRLRSEERLINNGVSHETPARYEMGTVISWCSATLKDTESKGAQWRIAFDRGGESDLSGLDVVGGVLRALKWTSQFNNYAENDAPFTFFRNKLGKFCGKASEAPTCATAQSFSRFMVKREGELYNPLKNRSCENNWGGKSGSRNLWMQSMREYGHDFEALRNGLIMLESAFYELVTGDLPPLITEEIAIEARRTLSAPESRFNVELESIGSEVTGLWNSHETRSIFLEVTKSTKSIGFLALALDLLCRNCKAYLEKVSVSSRWASSVITQDATAEGNTKGWGVTSTRRAAANVSYEHFFN